VETPHFSAFADEAMVFRKAFCAAPTCSPSRAAMLTGMSPHCVNMLGLAHRGFGPVDGSRHLARYLQENGYHTILAGIQHETTEAGIPDLGYQERIKSARSGGAPGSPDLETARLLAERLRARLPEAPLFVSFGTFMPHRVFPEPGPDDIPERLTPPYPVSDTPEGRLDFAAFRAAVRVADEAFGVLVNALKASGRWDKCIVIATTDHGPAFPGMKCALHDTGIGVTFMVKRAQATGSGTTDSLVSHLDLFPTLCDLAGIDHPVWLQGHSLIPILDNPNAEVREELFGEATYHAAYQPMRAVRTSRHKLIRHFDPERLRPVLANVDEGPERERLLASGWEHLAGDLIELYDLATDPFETRNLISDPTFHSVRDDLLALLDAWMRETSDPLVSSCPRIPAPPGATVNQMTSRSPSDQIFE
jgi:arylsulfatase A-like enzyme